jgi:hypothetical protein
VTFRKHRDAFESETCLHGLSQMEINTRGQNADLALQDQHSKCEIETEREKYSSQLT